jgi:hypothetical protein
MVLAFADALGLGPHRVISWTAVALALAGTLASRQKRRRAFEAAADALEVAIIRYETTESQSLRELEAASVVRVTK